LSHREFTTQFETPACIEVMAAETFGTYAYLQVDRSLVFVMIDRLLGGGRQPSPVVRRALTEIETSLFLRLTEAWREEMSRQLSQHQPVTLRSVRVESQSERLPSADGPWMLTEMSLRVAGQTGRCRVGIPLGIVAQLKPPGHDSTALTENLPPTGIAVIAGNVRLRTDETHHLKVGQTLFTDDLPRVYVDRKLMYTARLGARGEQKAIQIDQNTPTDTAGEEG
jgi:flagellar motor switch protein FliM